MKAESFFLPILLASAICLATFIGQAIFIRKPRGWKRPVAWLGLYSAFLGLSLFLYSHGAMTRLRHSIRGMTWFSQVEQCIAPEKVHSNKNAMSDFQAWAKYVQKAQGKEKGRGQSTFSKVSGEECELRLSDEPWLHYHWRQLQKRFNVGSLHFASPEFSLQSLVAKLQLKWVDWKEERRRKRLLRTSGIPGTSDPLSLNLVFSEFPDSFTEKFIKILTSESLRPVVISGQGPGTCETLTLHPDQVPQIQFLSAYLKLHLQACQERADILLRLGKRPDPCDSEALQKRIHLGCISQGGSSPSLVLEQKKAEGEDHPWISILKVPQDYFSGTSNEYHSYRILRLEYSLARVLNPSFVYQQAEDQLAWNAKDREERTHLVSGSDLILTRLGGVQLFSPFAEGEPPEEIQKRIKWPDMFSQMESLLGQFRSKARLSGWTPLADQGESESQPNPGLKPAGSSTSDLTPHLIRYLQLPALLKNKPIREFEARIARSSVVDCRTYSYADRLECVVESIHRICAQNKELASTDCLGLGDLFAAIYTAGRYIVGPADLWRFRGASDDEWVTLAQRIYSQYAQSVGKAYELMSAQCQNPNDSACEAMRLEKFCFDYSVFRHIPFSTCEALVLKQLLIYNL